jgi:thiol-disulfide isomerase/thioredoxin
MFTRLRQSWYLLALLSSCAWADVEVGKEPPDYLGMDSEGQKILVSEHRGRLVVISFFASWCGPCREELPALEAIQRAGGKDIVRVVAINYKESPQTYRRIRNDLRSYTLTFTHDRNGKISKSYGVKGIPRLVIVGKDGKVAAQHVGYDKDELPKLTKELDRFLNEGTQVEPASASTPGSTQTEPM